MQLDYYFWLNSDWAYLGAQRLEQIAARHALVIAYKPVDLLSVYARTGGIPLHTRAPERQAYREQELRRWTRHLGIDINITPKYMCPDAALASKLTIAADVMGFPIAALYRDILAAQWCQEQNIADRNVLLAIADRHDLPGQKLLNRAEEPDIVQRYQQYSEEAVTAGVFGSPSYVFDGEVFWGQDRLAFLEQTIAIKMPTQ